jgi:hypothetical protein
MANKAARVTLWVVITILLLPIVTLVAYKPSRVFMPSLVGVECPTERICIDDKSRFDHRKSLYDSAMADIEGQIGGFSYAPKIIFCATQQCFESFGFKRAAAHTLGKVATVIGPKGWRDYYVKHKLIHQWQADHIGSLTMLFVPEWLTEGMAYYLSDDPRSKLSEPWQSYRAKFAAWYEKADKKHFVAQIKAEI